MKSVFALAVIFASSASLAHVQSGTFTGKDQNGKVCSFTVGAEYFENNQPHPLNERLPVSGIQFNGHTVAVKEWNVGHPPVVNIEKGLVRFNHDYFQGIVATKTGAASLILLKTEEEVPEGHAPLGIKYIEDNYRNRQESKVSTCTL